VVRLDGAICHQFARQQGLGLKVDLKPRSQRPTCLLDIDGVLVLMGSGDVEATFEAVVAGFPVVIAVAARDRLSRLANAFQIVWASSWQRAGAESLGPMLGLPGDLPFLRFDPGADRDAASYKLPVIERFKRDRPAALMTLAPPNTAGTLDGRLAVPGGPHAIRPLQRLLG
jgi:hypothetical protein